MSAACPQTAAWHPTLAQGPLPLLPPHVASQALLMPDNRRCLRAVPSPPAASRAVPSPPAASEQYPLPLLPSTHPTATSHPAAAPSAASLPQSCLPHPQLPSCLPHLGSQRCPRHAAQLLPVSRWVCDVLLERVQELLECQVMPTCEASFKSALMGGWGCGNRARGLGAAGRSLRMHGARLSLRVWRWREMQGPGATVPHSAPRHPPTFSSAFLASS